MSVKPLAPRSSTTLPTGVSGKRLPASSLAAVHALEKRCLTMVALAERDAARRQQLLNSEIERLREAVEEKDKRIDDILGNANDDPSKATPGQPPSVYSGLRACEKRLQGFEEQLFSARNAFAVVHGDVTSQLTLLQENRNETEGKILASINSAVFVQEHYSRFVRQRRLQHAFVRLLRRIFLVRWHLRDRANDTPELLQLHRRIQDHPVPPLAPFSVEKFMKLLSSNNKQSITDPLSGYRTRPTDSTPKSNRRRFRTQHTPSSRALSSIASPTTPLDFSVLSPLSKSVVDYRDQDDNHDQSDHDSPDSVSPSSPTTTRRGVRLSMNCASDNEDCDERPSTSIVDGALLSGSDEVITQDDAMLVLALLEGRRLGNSKHLSLGSWLFRIVRRNGSPLTADFDLRDALVGEEAHVHIGADPWLENFVSTVATGDCPAAQPVLMYLCGSVDLLQRLSNEMKAHLNQSNVDLKDLQQHRLLATERQWLRERSRDLCFREMPRLPAHHSAVGNALLLDIQETAADRHKKLIDEFGVSVKAIQSDSSEILRKSSELLSHDSINDMIADSMYMTPEKYISRVDSLYTLPARSFWMVTWREMMSTATLQLMAPSSWRDVLAEEHAGDVSRFRDGAAGILHKCRTTLTQYEAWLEDCIRNMSLITLPSGPMQGKRVPMTPGVAGKLLAEKKKEIASMLTGSLKELWGLFVRQSDDELSSLPTMQLQISSALSDILRAIHLAHSGALGVTEGISTNQSALSIINELGIQTGDDTTFQAAVSALGGSSGDGQFVDVSLPGLMSYIVDLFAHPPPTPFVRDAGGSNADPRPIASLSLEMIRERWDKLGHMHRSIGSRDSLMIIDRTFPFLSATSANATDSFRGISDLLQPPTRILESAQRLLSEASVASGLEDNDSSCMDTDDLSEADRTYEPVAMEGLSAAAKRMLSVSPAQREGRPPGGAIAARNARKALQINSTVCKRLPVHWFNVLELGTVTTVHVSSASRRKDARPMWNSIITAADASVVENLQRRMGLQVIADRKGTGAIRILPPSADFEDALKPFSTVGSHEVEFVAMPPGMGARRAIQDDPSSTEYSNVVPIVRTPISAAVESIHSQQQIHTLPGHESTLSATDSPSADIIYVNTLLAPAPSHLLLSTLINRADEVPERIMAGLVMNASADYDSLRMEFSDLLGSLELRIRERYHYQLDYEDALSDMEEMESPDSPKTVPSAIKSPNVQTATTRQRSVTVVTPKANAPSPVKPPAARKSRKLRNGMMPVQITTFSLEHLRHETNRQNSQRLRLEQRATSLLEEAACLKAELAQTIKEKESQRAEYEAQLKSSRASTEALRSELDGFIEHQRSRDAADAVLDRLPETLRELRYTVGEETFGPCWQESILRIREVVQQDLLIDAEQMKQRISHMLLHEIEGSQVIERRFEDRMESLLDEIDKDRMRDGELVKMRSESEKGAYYDMCQMELRQAKDAAELDKNESIERHRQAYERRMAEMEELYAQKSRQLRMRQQEKEGLLESKLLSIRRAAREKELKLTDHFEARHKLLTDELEAEVRASKEIADNIRNEMEAEVLKIRANTEREAHENYLAVKMDFDHTTSGIYNLVLEDRQQMQETFFDARWETLKDVFQSCFDIQSQRDKETEERFQQKVKGHYSSALELQASEAAKAKDELTTSHLEALKTAERSHMNRVEHYKTTHDAITNDLRDKRINSEQTFWSQCQNTILEAERFVHSYKKELEVAHTKGYEELIHACDQYLENDIALSREAFESELRQRRQHLLDYSSYYHKIELRVQQLMWQEVGARSYVERLADTELESLGLAKAMDFETVKLLALNVDNASNLDACQWGCIEEEEDMLLDGPSEADSAEEDSSSAEDVESTDESTKKQKKKRSSRHRGRGRVTRRHRARIVFGRIRGTEGGETQLFVPRVDLVRMRERYERKLMEVLRTNEQIQRDYVSALQSEITSTRSEGSRTSHHHSSRIEIIADHLNKCFSKYQESRSFIVEQKLESIVTLTTKKLTSLSSGAENGKLPFFDHLSQVHRTLEGTEPPKGTPMSPNRRRAKTPAPKSSRPFSPLGNFDPNVIGQRQGTTTPVKGGKRLNESFPHQEMPSDGAQELPRVSKRQQFRRTLTDLLGLLYSPDRLAEEIIFFNDSAAQYYDQPRGADSGLSPVSSGEYGETDAASNEQGGLGAARAILHNLLSTDIDLPVPNYDPSSSNLSNTTKSLVKRSAGVPANTPHSNHAATMIGYYMCVKAFLSTAMRAFTVQSAKQVEQLERARENAFGKAHREYVEASGALMERIHVYSRRAEEERQAALFLSSRLSMAGEEIRQTRESCETLRAVLREVVKGKDTNSSAQQERRDKVSVPSQHVTELYNLRERIFANEWIQSNADVVMRARTANMALVGTMVPQ